MAKKAKEAKAQGEVNRSQAIRELLKENPKIKAAEAVSALAEKGIKIKVGLFYMVKGKLSGR
jgi:outer membrane protein TolC